MLLESQLSEVLDSQNQSFLNKKTGLIREKLSDLTPVDNFVLIITGVRRCGKSTLLYQLMQKNYHDVLFLSFEDIRLAGFETDDFIRLLSEIKKREKRTLFFDEIQILTHWELFVRQLLDEEYKIVITGSNATLLSRELGSKLTGRHLSTELFPFSYHEFLDFKNLPDNSASLTEYMQKGGFPEYLKSDEDGMLNQLLDDILNRDIAIRYGVRDVTMLKKLAVYLISNIGKPVSGNKLKDMFGIRSTTTILEFFSYLENSYVIQFLSKFSYAIKNQIRNPKKIYAIDLGLFSQTSIVFSDEKGRRLENLVYLHLRKTEKEVYYFQEKKECDFVVVRKGKAAQLLQVCYELTTENLERETSGLLAAMDFFNMDEGKIITFNQTETFNKNGKVISVIPAWQFVG
ncbi:ATP-binding protein (plasmid) [Pedobacter sp. BS3]|uniref:ATP-binding protein n=1 Tax=Pedobacter sp. BS3 TaxID=2567937 RepID=UPI0011EF8023|nr:ATP-binding protein [Pedobacter sp. BS3]TZF85907.1 ATP-binding protein [Pedobacter sp. BS3]